MKEVGSVISVSPKHALPSTPITKAIKPEKKGYNITDLESIASTSSKRRHKVEINKDTPVTNNVSWSVLPRSAKSIVSSKEDLSL